MITFGEKKSSLKFFDLNRIIHVEQHEFYASCQHKSNHCHCSIATNCIQNTSMLNCTKTLIHIEFILRLMRTHDLIQKSTEICVVSKINDIVFGTERFFVALEKTTEILEIHKSSAAQWSVSKIFARIACTYIGAMLMLCLQKLLLFYFN